MRKAPSLGRLSRLTPMRGVLGFSAAMEAMAQQRRAMGPPRARNVLMVGLGDSRVPTFTDAPKRQKGGTDILNLIAARSNQRYRVAGAFGQSGKRPDEFLQALPDAIALGGGILWIPSVLNGIGQDYPTLATSGSDALARILAAADTAIAAGYVVFVGSEIGQVGIAQVRLDQINIYNNGVQQAAKSKRGLVFVDIRGAVCDANGVVRNELTYDGTHFNGKGAMIAAAVVEPVMAMSLPAGLSFVLNGGGVPEIGGYTNIAPNPLFAVATGGGTSTGATGTYAGSTNFNKTGAGAALAVASAAGNVTMTGTFTAQNDNVRCSQAANSANWSPGDLVRGMAMFNVTNATGLAGVQMTLVATVDSVATTWSDLAATATWAGPDGSFGMLALTQEYAIPAGTAKNSLAVTLQATAYGAGGLTLKPLQMGILKKV